MGKICSCCLQERDEIEDFRWKYKDRGIRQTRCKYCQSELSKLHYQNNKQVYNERSHSRKERILAENRFKIHSYLSIHPCVDCGQVDIRLLEFDHVSGQKAAEVIDLFRQGYGWATLEAEIAKCEIRCANCHRIRTFEHWGSWRNNPQQRSESYQKMYAYLSSHSCVDCGETDIRLFEFDHVRGQKVANVSRLLTQGYGWPTLETEIAKCEVRCANCHRIKTYERGNHWRAEMKS